MAGAWGWGQGWQGQTLPAWPVTVSVIATGKHEQARDTLKPNPSPPAFCRAHTPLLGTDYSYVAYKPKFWDDFLGRRGGPLLALGRLVCKAQQDYGQTPSAECLWAFQGCCLNP